MADWILNNLPQALLLIGLICLVIEVAVFGFSTFFLFFFGCSAIATAILLWIGILPASLMAAITSLAVVTAIFAAVMWQPLKKLQEPTKVTSDLIGVSFSLTEDISPAQPGRHKYSGIEWQVTSQDAIDKGTMVEVVAVQVGVLTVKASH